MSIQEGRDGRFLPIVMQAQVADIVGGFRTALLLNLVSLTAAILILRGQGEADPAVALWYAAALIVIGVRALSLWLLKHRGLLQSAPLLSLRVLWIGGFGLGMVWAALPVVIPRFDAIGAHASLLIIMGGMAAGSVIRQIGYTPMAMSYSLPIFISLMVSLLFQGGLDAALVGTLLGFIIGVFIHRSLWAERLFISSQLARRDATALADSLTRANSDILRQNRRLEALANRDPLTDLASRVHFHGRLAGDIARAAVLGEQVVLVIFDVVRFQAINDTLGHSNGDALLREIGRRLSSVVDDGSLIARLGGDEFAIIVTGKNAGSRGHAHADAVLEAFRSPLTWRQRQSTIALNGGLAVYPCHAENAEDLLACADMALYDAKRQERRGLREFDPELRRNAERGRMIEQDLLKAIEGDMLCAWFQPQVDLGSRRVTGVEALVRWHHPTLGFIPPPEIVNAARATDQSEALTARIVADACLLVRKLDALGHSDITVAVNLSPREFALYPVDAMLERVTRAHGVEPHRLEIEITEEAILDPAHADTQLTALGQAGYRLAVDDFGMGHSSLAYLIGLKLDRLKIDRQFVQDVSLSETNQKLITALVGLGRSLSLDIVVEGVETEEDAAELKRLGCTTAQGFLFARAMTAVALVDWLADNAGPARVERRSKTTGRTRLSLV
ncbi:putative bifunctional diguanylate cyclase/phosphodiesterase [Rhizobium sp. G187]|uniref:putative bifunctional diguanylate cyclase/phosphodiesterase n=1 Tax=Rhizobium sp. G187 TaxID=3451352 RepID=UPI003EE65423